MTKDTQITVRPKTDEVFPKGTRVAEHYEITECLGVGRTSTVYRVRHLNFSEHDLVLKLLHSKARADKKVEVRFQTEILASYDVNHENVIRCFEFISAPNVLGYTMEYAPGGDISQLINEHELLPIDDVLDICMQICSGLEAIHRAGIVHRDLKPENIFMMGDGLIKIADFGIAKTKTGKRITAKGEVLGALNYSSPEYVQTGEVDSRSDIYAFGLIAYQLATGTFPFGGGLNVDSLLQRMQNDPRSPIEKRRDCPLLLSECIMQSLARDPQQRYQSATEMLEVLVRTAKPRITEQIPPMVSEMLRETKSLNPEPLLDTVESQLESTPEPSIESLRVVQESVTEIDLPLVSEPQIVFRTNSEPMPEPEVESEPELPLASNLNTAFTDRDSFETEPVSSTFGTVENFSCDGDKLTAKRKKLVTTSMVMLCIGFSLACLSYVSFVYFFK